MITYPDERSLLFFNMYCRQQRDQDVYVHTRFVCVAFTHRATLHTPVLHVNQLKYNEVVYLPRKNARHLGCTECSAQCYAKAEGVPFLANLT